MGLLDRLKSFLNDGDDDRRSGYGSPRYDTRSGPRQQQYGRQAYGRGARSDDEQAVERYRYLLRTARPEEVEEVHAEAFARLTPEQRRLLFEELSSSASATDRPASDDPRALARSATRSEMRQPGFLERTLGGGAMGGAGRGPGLGTMIGGSLLGTVAGVVIGSAIASAIMPGIGDLGADFAASAEGLGDGVQDFGSDVSEGFGGDWGGGGGDFGGGGGFGDFGGDF